METPEPTAGVPAHAADAGEDAEVADPVEMTVDEYADLLVDLWRGLADASSEFAANVTNSWWNALPIARPEGMNMAGMAAVMAARLAKLGPDGDPLEMLTMGMISYAQHSRDQALAELANVERQRQALHEQTVAETSTPPSCSDLESTRIEPGTKA
ncbi:hypothetical protein [Nocardia macrotermitis]|uniref:Uncharacterized protein n=1 Tax=Nocardia macrotermitis TaxID=2585198 RepID=A0A7K0D400_9NOCA|nr:hypothetical protein [Nocardia macrotermitis]MQY20450.1 hypothetical protein [Nocardia macrotermitis]